MKGDVILIDIFAEIRNQIPMQYVAKFYGIHINHSGVACCPFHNDKTPSMKIYDDHFYCFGCHENGDGTGFVAKLFGLSQYEAAKKISYDFGLRLFEQEIAVPVQIKLSPESEYHAWLRNSQRIVSEYLKKLYEWREMYTPTNQMEALNPLFIESLEKTGYVEYLSEMLTYGTDKDKRDIYKANRNTINQIQQHLKSFAAKDNVVKQKAI